MPANRVEPVEAIASYARRTKGTVRIVLQLPAAEPTAGEQAQVRLTGRQGSVRARATITAADPGVCVEVSVPAKKLPPGIWKIAVRIDPETPFGRVQARLLTSRTQPIALLPGPPSRRQIEPPRRLHRPRRPQLVERSGRLVDRGLRRLPDERAAKYRASLRKAARRLFG